MANLNIRVDDELKRQAENLFAELGLNMSTAVTIFLKQSIRYSGIPFELRISDPFYSVENQESLRKSIADYKSGKTKLVTKTIEELEEMAMDRS